MDWMTQMIVSSWEEIEKQGRGGNPVVINYEQLDEVIEEHTPKVLATKSHLPPMPGVSSRDSLVAASYIIAGNIWNFGYKTPGQGTYRVANPKDTEKPFEGFMAFWHKLYRNFGEHIITAAMLKPHVQSVKAMREFFHDLTDIPLPELRQQCGFDYVQGLERRFKGDPKNILYEWSDNSSRTAMELVEILVNAFPVAYGQDIRILDGKIYPFYKRARLAVMLLHSWRVPHDPERFIIRANNIDELAPPTDYQLPRLLHSPQMNVLMYTPLIDRMIEEGNEIIRGSREEVLIRAATQKVCAYWMERKKIPGWRLDAYLFSISRGLPNKAHYTKTSDY